MKIVSKMLAFLRPFFTALALAVGLCLASSIYAHAFGSRSDLDTMCLERQGAGTARVKELARPEQFIDSAVNYGLNFVLPETIRNGLIFDAGYDRWSRRTTLKMDSFLPVKAWSDKSLFVSPRVCLTGTRETLSVGCGMRKLIGSDAMIGFHTFHDWVRSRGSNGSFLREVGAGVELSALPGKYSDLSLAVNAYLPVNERTRVVRKGRALARESLSYGGDAQVSFLLPALSDRFDIQLDGPIHSYKARETNVSGYSGSVTVSSRDGMLTASFERGRDTSLGDNFEVRGGLTLAFDWADLLEGKNPFSSPYGGCLPRFNRKIRDSLYARPVRQYDLPTDRTERSITFSSAVDEDTVTFHGIFPDLPNAPVTVQVAQSPWRDIMKLTTDARGAYAGKLHLPPGEYRVRLIHKATGMVTGTAHVAVESVRYARSEAQATTSP
jgi:hypothetical protein